MSNEWIAHFTVPSFSDFVTETPNDKLGIAREPDCLADFIESWVFHGVGIRACVGDFQTFTIAVLAIVDEWMKRPYMLDYVPESDDEPIVERRVESFLDERGFRHRALDPHFFARCVYVHRAVQ
jgi:hypothetical protein